MISGGTPATANETKRANDAIAADKKDRDAVRAGGLSIKNFSAGALGKWSFDKNGDTTLRTMSGNTVKGGKFAFMAVLGED
jgi:branched-chain amino acid transport system substrate-binding protein